MVGFATHLECARCGARLNIDEPHHLCTCGGPLLVRYDLEALGKAICKESLRERTPSLWRYAEFLPVADPSRAVTLGEGGTPLIPLLRWGGRRGFSRLVLKDEGLNPTGTFKSRGASVGITRAVELGVTEVALPTAGNAGGAWALYGARAGLRSHIAMPKDAPAPAVRECVAAGACVYLVDGLISDAGEFISLGIKKNGWYDASTLKEPYRIEGKKTMGLELAEQCAWDLPSVVLFPCGGGVGIIAIAKAFDELEQMGWIDSRRPRLVAVQAEGCAPIVKAFREGKSESEFFSGAETVAGGIRVPKARGDFLVLRAIRETRGTAVAVTDEELLAVMHELAAEEGVLVSPEGAAAVAALERMRDQGLVEGDERVVVFNTGSGLKYSDLIRAELPVSQTAAMC